MDKEANFKPPRSRQGYLCKKNKKDEGLIDWNDKARENNWQNKWTISISWWLFYLQRRKI